jgi:hypothetical protein
MAKKNIFVEQNPSIDAIELPLGKVTRSSDNRGVIRYGYAKLSH